MSFRFNQQLHNHRHHQEQLVEFLEKQEVTHFVTLTFNRTVLLHVGRRKFGEFLARMDKRLLGRSWLKKTNQRVFAVAFPENIMYNTHYHAAFRVAPEHTDRFAAIADQLWRDLVLGGDCDVQPTWDLKGLVTYVTKQARREPVYENMVVSTEFHPR